MNLLKTIKSNQFAIIVAILSVVVQSFHSYTAFYNTSSLHGSLWGVAQAILFAVVIDMAILFYTVRGRKDIALYAAGAMVLINAYYYYQHLGVSFEFVFGVFLSLIIPVSVYFYSEEIHDDDETEKDVLIRQQLETMKVQQDTINKAIADTRVVDSARKSIAEAFDKKVEENAKLHDKIRSLTAYIESIPPARKDFAPSSVGNYSEKIKPYQYTPPTVEQVSDTEGYVSDVEYEEPEDKSLLGVESHTSKAYNPTRAGSSED